MLKKYNFVIFTLVFSLLFAWVFYTGYTRTDSAVEAGQANSTPGCCQTGSAPSMDCDSGTDCSSSKECMSGADSNSGTSCSSSTGCNSRIDCKRVE